MKMHDPEPPGELLQGWLSDLGVSVTDFAAHLGISRVMLSKILHGHAAVTADMDLKLSEALGTTPGYWLALQTQRDLWTAGQAAKDRNRIKRMAAPALACRSNSTGAKQMGSSVKTVGKFWLGKFAKYMI